MPGAPEPFNTSNPLETERLALALEMAGIGTWEFSAHSNEIRLCTRSKNLLDFAGNDIVDFNSLIGLIYPEDRAIFESEVSRALEQTPPEPFSVEFRSAGIPGGQSRWILCKGQSHQEPDSEKIRVLGTFIDITKEVQGRSTLKDARSFQTIVEQAPMAIGLLTGPDLIIELGNDKLFEVWGKEASITGLKLMDALPEIQNQGFNNILNEVYLTGKPFIGSGALAQLYRNGRLEDAYFDFVYSPMQSEDGSISGIMVMANEVTHQHRMLKELEANEAKFKALIDQAPVATCLFVGKEMVIELANQPMIDYWGKDKSVIGKPLAEALPELEGQPFLDILNEILVTGIAYSSKNAAVDIEVDGKLSTYYFNFSYKPIFDGSGNIYGIINMSMDVTAQVKAQKALEESESKLRTVIASAPAAIGLFVGRDLVVELPNQAFIDIVGKGPDIEGIPLREVMPELDSQPFLQILDDVYTTGVTYQSYGTQVNIVQNGVMTYNFYDITYSPVYDNEGKVYAILDIAIDVTERVNVERQVAESQLQLLALFEQSPVGIAMIHKDNLTFTMANPFYGKLVGRKPEEIIGKSLLEALPEIDGQGFDKLLQHVIDTGIPYFSREQAVEIMYDGVLETIYVDMAYQPQRNLQDQITGVFVVATDLTEQVVNRKKIQETEAFLRGAIELAELGTFSIDLRTGTMDFSDRFKMWFGLTKENPITFEMVYAAVSEADQPGVLAAVNRAVAPGSDGLYDMEYSLDPEKTGAERILHAQGKVLYNQAGEPIMMIGTAQDVTDQRKIKLSLEQQVQQRTEELETINEELAAINEEYVATNEELADSNNMLQQSNINLQQFAYVASHDLQEPLRKIQSFSDLLIKRYGENLGDGTTYLNRMQAAAKRMSELIDDLLAFSRVTTQKEMNRTVSLNLVLDVIVNDLELAIAESSAVITIDSLPWLKGDQTQLGQLFLNLLSNALKFRKPGVSPVINITSRIISGADLPSSVNVTRTTSAYYQVDVADNGIGFDQQYADKIFQLFQRLHGRSQYSGTGIGLAICERVAANHGGAITVVSEPGVGTTFSIFLPVT
ncbi:Adaptive-response sensory-kinase SasA [Dyadobacter sp. CECT 9623]|uniref:histidine kinase n=1 Tax=Dyadobacter linearis TaxID=2823330 RepID=A0ABM8UJQ1_9BACT|nr:PAS domain-containing protein [Dyadobacter sp. CECT 9623]CAG5067613.1 Adaptive-response sensory-kinase SasA [Dyadobacter sp. CECT 9623]